MEERKEDRPEEGNEQREREGEPLLGEPVSARKARDLVAANMRSNILNSPRSERVLKIGALWAFLVIAASVTVMVVTGTGCDKPLVVWLSVYCGALLCTLLVDWLAAKNLEASSRRRSCLRCVFNSLSFLGIMFEFAWMIVGNIWVYKADDCSNGIWGLSLTLVIIWYIKLALPVLICLLFCISLPFLLYLMRYAAPSGATPATDVTLHTGTNLPPARNHPN